MDAPTRIALEALYRVLIAAVVQLASTLGKPCPVITRADRRAERALARDC